jgi:tetratricopeptide (TPR) repeat protein
LAGGSLGFGFAQLGETRRALEYYDQQLTIAQDIGNRCEEGNGLGDLANGYAVVGDIPRAIKSYQQQLTIVQAIGNRRGEASALGGLGNAYADVGDTCKAIDHFERSLSIAARDRKQSCQGEYAARARRLSFFTQRCSIPSCANLLKPNRLHPVLRARKESVLRRSCV